MLEQTKQPLPRSAEWHLRKERQAPGVGIAERTLREAVDAARDALLAKQHTDGYWCFELEADCTIPAEYILMMHYMDEIDEALQAKIA
ncbi:MAG: hypothetical protein GTO41_01380, partial [Burkholderiales bacterium]|nr:hypothetical protein [Burkholderiales bacterium]